MAEQVEKKIVQDSNGNDVEINAIEIAGKECAMLVHSGGFVSAFSPSARTALSKKEMFGGTITECLVYGRSIGLKPKPELSKRIKELLKSL